MPNSKYLAHHGVKGMKWGVRRYQNKNGDYTMIGKHRLNRDAKKDAKEFARAKMYYGEGAGNRRKLIKATVNERSKDPNYKKKFDEYYQQQNMADHASKAKKERRTKDINKSVKKNARGAVNILTGHPERLGASLTMAYGAYRIAHKYNIDKLIINEGKRIFNDAKTKADIKRGAQILKDMMN